MTPEEFKELKTVDVIKSKINGANYVIIAAKYPLDPITQIKKISIEHRYGQYDILSKKL